MEYTNGLGRGWKFEEEWVLVHAHLHIKTVVSTSVQISIYKLWVGESFIAEVPSSILVLFVILVVIVSIPDG